MPLNNSHIHHHPSDTTNGDQSHDTNDHPPPVIVQETDDEDDILQQQQQQDDLATTAIPLLEIDEETLNSGAEGYVRFDLYIILYYTELVVKMSNSWMEFHIIYCIISHIII